MPIDFKKLMEKEDAKAKDLRKRLADAKVGNDAIDLIDAGVRCIKEAGNIDEAIQRDVVAEIGVEIKEPEAPKPIATVEDVMKAVTPELKADLEAKLSDKRTDIEKARDEMPEVVRKEFDRVQKELQAERDKRIDAEVAEIAKSYDKIPVGGDDLRAMIRKARIDGDDKTLRGLLDKVQEVMKTAETHKEIGSGSTNADAEGDNAIVELAKSWAKETGFKGSDADALDEFLRTEKGREAIKKHRS